MESAGLYFWHAGRISVRLNQHNALYHFLDQKTGNRKPEEVGRRLGGGVEGDGDGASLYSYHT